LTNRTYKRKRQNLNNAGELELSFRINDMFTASSWTASVIAVILGFLTATLFLRAIGRNPSGMYQALLQVVSGFDSRRGTWNARYVGEWLVVSIPLILCALSMGFAVRSGLFNIGAEGQYIAGVTAAQITAIFFPPVPVLHLAAAVCAAMLAGAVWGGITGFLKARYRVSEVVAAIMLNYIALYLHRIITMRIPGSSTFRTVDFPVTASLSSSALAYLTNGSRLNYGLWFAAAAVVIYRIIMEKTALGFSLRAVGFNREAAQHAGIRVKLNITAAMMIAGAFAGLAGACVSLGVFSYGRILSSFDNYGFDGIAAALCGNCTGAGIAVTGLLFGMLKSAQPLMQARQIPGEITSIIMALVVVFLSLRSVIQMFAEWRMKRLRIKEVS
jgi:general nucleoside transport system permease protein